MNTSLKAVLTMVGVAALASAAQANSDTTAVLSGTTLGGTTYSFTVATDVAPVAGGYQYTYTAELGSVSPLYIDSFTVQDVVNQVGLNVNNTPVFWSATPSTVLDNVNWTTGVAPGPASPGNLTLQFGFFSPDGPVVGGASANDSVSYAETSGTVLVPGVPDSSMTMTLLGGALLGLGAVRRKLGC